MKRLTMRSSSEWKLTTTSRPPGFRMRSAANSARASSTQLVIDEDAQCLEHTRGGMDLVAGLAADMRFDGVGKVERALERPLLPPRFDHAGDAAGMPLFAEKIEDARQIARLETVDDIGGRQALLRHAHVERPVEAEGKAALRLVKLHGRHADIQHDAVHLFDMLIHRREWRFDQTQAAGELRFERLPVPDRIGIAVEGDDVGARFQNRARIAARAKGAIDDVSPGFGSSAASTSASITGRWRAAASSGRAVKAGPPRTPTCKGE